MKAKFHLIRFWASYLWALQVYKRPIFFGKLFLRGMYLQLRGR